jgi:citrate synthase
MLLTAREAADRLGIKLDTLYAYVSRGRLRSLAVAGTRQRRYRVEEVDALRDAVVAPARAETAALTPIIASSICLIENGRLYYRGRDALRLAETASLEEVAALLWQEEVREPADPQTGVSFADRPPSVGAQVEAGLGLIERCQLRLARLSAADLAALDLTRAGVVRTGRLILDELTACVGETEVGSHPIHRRIAAGWRLNEAGAKLVRCCLVLLADHELNASTFVARCVASTGATPYAVVSAALAALSGRRHGGASAQAEALLHELAGGGDPLTVMAARLARNEMLPGFGQPLYPDGDPRAVAIFDTVAASLPDAWDGIEHILDAAARLVRQRPNVDFALAAAMAVLGLPQGAALSLFVIGRTVGWIAHAIEQYETGTLIRPRARYTGPRPEEGPD